MHYELEQQQDYIEQLESESNTKIETFADGRYTDELRECCISLLSLGIGRNKIDPAIRTVLRLAGKTVERLPAPSTINNMVSFRNCIWGRCFQQPHTTPSIQMEPPNLVKSMDHTKSQQQKPVIHLRYVK